MLKKLNVLIALGLFLALLATRVWGDEPTDHRDGAPRPQAPVTAAPADPAKSKEENSQLLRRLFHERLLTATKREGQIRGAIEGQDEKLTAELVTELIFARSDDEKKTLLTDLQKELVKPEVQADPLRRHFVERLLWTIEKALNVSGDTSAVAKRYKEKVGPAYAKAEQQGELFYKKLDEAEKGNSEALAWLEKEYGDNVLQDFMGVRKGEVGAHIAHTLGWQDNDGVTHFDVEVAGENGAPATHETRTLGKTAEEIAKALDDYDPTHDGSGWQTSGKDAHPPAQRHFVRIDSATHRPVAYTPHLLYPEDRQICRIPSPVEKEVPTRKHPNYFFRPFPDSQYGSYAGVDENFILNMNTGTEQKMPGSYDPVPTPDEKYMTIPSDDQENPNKGLTFFVMKDLLSGHNDPIFVDKQMKGVYQSIGLISEGDGGATTYRAITAQRRTLRVRDYKLTPTPTGVRVDPQGSEPKILCKNLTDEGVELSLPMISKNGRQLAALEVRSGFTKIYTLSDDGRTCSEEVNLGMLTGKVDFSYDNDQITFHKYNNELRAVDYVEVPSDEMVANVYVYKRSTGEIARLTNNTDSNAVYPAFRRDGTIVFLQHPHGASHDTGGPSKLVVIRPELAKQTPVQLITKTGPASAARYQALTALGALWSNLCSPAGNGVGDESAVLATLGLDRDRCVNMVNKYWNSFRDGVFNSQLPHLKMRPAEFKSLTAADLLALCPKEASAPTPPRTGPPVTPPPVGVPPVAGDRTPQMIIRDCKHCHDEPGMPDLPFENPAEFRTRMTVRASPPVPLRDELIRRIGASDADVRMPPRSPLNERERAALLEFLHLN